MIPNRSIRCGTLTFLMVTAGCDPGTTVEEPAEGDILPTPQTCATGTILIGTECVTPPEIKVNTVGYLPDRAKLATVPASDAASFALVDASTDEVVFEGELGEATENSDTGDTTQSIDFGGFTEEGTYVVRVEGFEDSPAFEIAADAWGEALRAVMLGLYGQRCGVDVEFEYQGSTFKHAACHLEDGIAGAEADGSSWSGGDFKDGTGGWHDAGDYGKYTVNGTFSVAFLFKAWEDFGEGLSNVEHIPSYDGDMPQWLAEAKFQMDQLLKMQFDDGSAAHLIGPVSFPNADTMPENDSAERHFSTAGSAATADLVATAAMASRVFREFDAEYADLCLAAAKSGQAFLDANPTVLEPSFEGFTHSAYSRQDDNCERSWALTELWRTTADPELLTRVEAGLPTGASSNFDWANVCNMALFSYVQTADDTRNADQVSAAQTAILGSADTLVSVAAAHAYGRDLGTKYWWGSNGIMARSAINLFLANTIAPDAKYLDAAVAQIDYLFGRNPFGRTMVTGVGHLPVQLPHHRPSVGDGVASPWPGLLVGGPNPNNHPLAASYPDLAPGLFWFDSSDDYTSNEVAINWSTALAYALAGFLN